jgi:hypothetical protein
MTTASRKTAVAIATPKSFSTRSSPAANEAKTATMTAAAAVITRPVRLRPSRTAALASQALAQRPEGEDALETVRKFILSLHDYKRDDLDEKMRLCIENDETLRSHLRARLASLEELIAPAIAKDLDAAEDDLRPQVVAASLTAAFTVLTERGEGPRGKTKTEEDVAAQIDPIITFLRGGLDALKAPGKTRAVRRA